MIRKKVTTSGLLESVPPWLETPPSPEVRPPTQTRAQMQLVTGAERLITAEKATRKIAVEVKSFLSPSRMEDLEDALGQLVLYRHVLGSYEPDREIYLAIREDVYLNFFDQPHVAGLCAAEEVCLIVFNSNSKEIVQWIP
jgi:hypothetical protein